MPRDNAEAILRAIVGREPLGHFPSVPGGPYCAYCCGDGSFHHPTCPWRRARQWVDGQTNCSLCDGMGDLSPDGCTALCPNCNGSGIAPAAR